MDEAWLSTLYERNYALLFRVGRVFLGNDPSQHGVIEEQIQETFIQAWQKRQTLEKHPNPDGWLVETFRYCLLNQCRKQIREWKRRSFSLDEEPAQQIPDTSVALLKNLFRPANSWQSCNGCLENGMQTFSSDIV